ncbi:MAG: alkaline phosphatase D family protein [Phycisphaerales bacterium]|nr:alkaline phosphatase D family protein [Phycisphaerales bacterium]
MPCLLAVLLSMLAMTSSLRGEVIMSDTFEVTPDRTWIGRDWWANRLQDWQVEDGRLICLEARPNLPVRTAHWITRYLAEGRNGLMLQVDLEPADAGKKASANAFAGFLLGAGSSSIDHRLTAQVHHHPAEDGGLLAVVDGDGIVAIRRFDKSGKIPGSWSINKAVELNQMPLLEPQTRSGNGLGTQPDRSIRLVVDIDGNTMLAKAIDPETGVELSRAEVNDLPARYLDGGIALVSHGGPSSRGRGFAFQNLLTMGDAIRFDPERSFGPVLSSMYTVDDGVLKMTAQMPPLGPDDEQRATLEVKKDKQWHEVASGMLDQDSATIEFRVEPWDAAEAFPYRIVYQEKQREGAEPWLDRYTGVIRAEPDGDETILAAMNCQKVYTGGLKWNHDGLWMPHLETVAGIDAHDPDLLFFAGDQIYEGDLTPVDARSVDKSLLDYLYKWYRFCWSFRDITRTRPTITIPDDHDVYHGNIWGANGRKAQKTDEFSAQDSGGYKKPPRVVNAIHRTQVSHLPDPVDPAPIEQGISVYFTDLDWGGISYAIIADRMFKSSPSVAVPEGRFKNGWPQAPGFDPVTQSDVEGAELLGPRQEEFLEQWAIDWDEDDWAKAVLSQTLFCNVATLPEGAESGGVIPGLPVPKPGEYPEGYRIIADGDSNGWPQSGRNRALRAMRTAGAIHVCGDQHLGSTVHYGIDEYEDAGWAFCVPAISNTWPRRWFPPTPGGNHTAGQPPYTGDYKDGFGNRMTVRAVANPVQNGHEPTNLYERMPGWGLVRFQRPERRIVMECWPRWTLPGAPDSEQYPGWPVVFDVVENYGKGGLPLVDVSCGADIEPLIRLKQQETGEVVQARRLPAGGGRVFVSSPGQGDERSWNLEASLDGQEWTLLRTELGVSQKGTVPTLHYDPGSS